MIATSKLISLFNKYGLQPWMLIPNSAKETIILKDSKDPADKKARRIPYKDNDFTNNAREQLQFINRHLEAAVIDLDLGDEQMCLLLKRLKRSSGIEDPKHLSMFNGKYLYRIFSKSSFKLHGLFYGAFWQNLPERDKTDPKTGEVILGKYRQHITINGEPTVELDFLSFHPKMIHDMEGLELINDPYVGIDSLDREHGKSIFNMMLNAEC